MNYYYLKRKEKKKTLQKQRNNNKTKPNSKRLSRVQKKIVARFCCCCLFGKPGHVVSSQRVLEGRRTTTAGWYVHHCLQKVFDVWCQLTLPRTGLRDLFLHHDTDSVIARTAATAVGFLDEGDVQLLPYWPELAPYNFFLFPELKKPQTGTLCLRAPKMHGRMFARAAEDIKLSKST